jgi:hypothetical protein
VAANSSICSRDMAEYNHSSIMITAWYGPRASGAVQDLATLPGLEHCVSLSSATALALRCAYIRVRHTRQGGGDGLTQPVVVKV